VNCKADWDVWMARVHITFFLSRLVNKGESVCRKSRDNNKVLVINYPGLPWIKLDRTMLRYLPTGTVVGPEWYEGFNRSAVNG